MAERRQHIGSLSQPLPSHFRRSYEARLGGSKGVRCLSLRMEPKAPWGLADAGPTLTHHGPGDLAVAKFSGLQHCLITTEQLHFLGLGKEAAALRVRRGALSRVHRGVYLVGPAPITDASRLAAAVLACGPPAVISHRGAAFIWGLLPLDPHLVDITLVGIRRPGRPGIRIHHAKSLNRLDLRRRELIPVTSPSLTLLAIAESEDGNVLEQALNSARQMKLVRRGDLHLLRKRTPGRQGWGPLGGLLARDDSDDFSRSKVEAALLRLIRRASLPAPRRNVRIHGHELDFFWPGLRLNVEVDGYEWHSARHRLNSDRDRDTHLASCGIQVVRFTRDQVRFRPEQVLARLAAALALAGAAA